MSPQALPKTAWDSGFMEMEIKRRLRREKVKLFVFEALFFVMAAVVIIFVI